MGRKTNAPQRQDEIIWALYDCLAENGHEKVTVKDIAARAGLTPGVIHYYFKSKDEIASKLALALFEKYSCLFEDTIVVSASPEQKMEKAIDFIVDNMIFSRPINRVFFNLLQMGYERETLGRVVKKMFEKYRGFLESMFQEMGATRDSRMLAAALVAVTEGFSIQVMVDPSAFERDTVRRIITQTVNEGLTSIKR